jgi:hypothetical protein
MVPRLGKRRLWYLLNHMDVIVVTASVVAETIIINNTVFFIFLKKLVTELNEIFK